MASSEQLPTLIREPGEDPDPLPLMAHPQSISSLREDGVQMVSEEARISTTPNLGNPTTTMILSSRYPY